MSHIYFIQEGTSGPIKIGFTAKNLQKRLSSVQISNPRQLVMIAAIPGCRKDECILHHKFAKAYIRGEWFKPVKSLMRYLATLPKLSLVCPGGVLLAADHHSWRGINASDVSKRARFQRRFPLTGIVCERCKQAAATDRRCKDNNYENFDPRNVELLCRKCRMQVDGTLENLRKVGRRTREVKEPTPCFNCKTPSKPLRKGLCGTCSHFFNRTGKHRTTFRGNSKSAKFWHSNK
jgi:hypothetical protein